MSLLEWLKFWSKFLRIPLLCSTEYPPTKKKWKLSECPSPSREYPPNENCHRVQVWVQNTLPKMKIVRESKSEYRIPPSNENCQRVQVRVQNTPSPKMKIVRESKSKYRIPPKMKIVRESKSEYRIPPQIKIVRESKSEYRIPPQLNFSHFLALWVFSVLTPQYPPPQSPHRP